MQDITFESLKKRFEIARFPMAERDIAPSPGDR
jgi:hypothetical protein